MQKLKLYIFFIFLPFLAQAQLPRVEAAIDSTRIMLESQANLTLKATAESGAKVVFPNTTTIGNLEVLEAYPVDTIEQGNGYELIKKYALTQFDAGRYTI